MNVEVKSRYGSRASSQRGGGRPPLHLFPQRCKLLRLEMVLKLTQSSTLNKHTGFPSRCLQSSFSKAMVGIFSTSLLGLQAKKRKKRKKHTLVLQENLFQSVNISVHFHFLSVAAVWDFNQAQMSAQTHSTCCLDTRAGKS